MCPSLWKEANQLYREANILYWTKALLKLTYDYIEHGIYNATDEAPPFEIPHLHFIDTGLLLSFAERPNPMKDPLWQSKRWGLSVPSTSLKS
jgi:hypothetical protein